MCENLIGEYGTLCPLSTDQIVELSRDIDAFEEMTDFTLASYLLKVDFLDRLADRVQAFGEQTEAEEDWYVVWAMVHHSDTVVGFWDFASAPNDCGGVVLNWVLNPEWESSPFEREALRALVDWAFSRDECRSISVESDSTGPDRAETLRKLGFRPHHRNDGGLSYRLVKTMEGQLL